MAVMSDEEIAVGMAKRLVAALRPQKVIWFGSRAAGVASPESDYDILVVITEPIPPDERAVLARRAVREFCVSKDVLVFTSEEYERLSRWPSTVVAQANRTGRTLFEAED